MDYVHQVDNIRNLRWIFVSDYSVFLSLLFILLFNFLMMFFLFVRVYYEVF